MSSYAYVIEDRSVVIVKELEPLKDNISEEKIQEYLVKTI